jgi:hypothetical protein
MTRIRRVALGVLAGLGVTLLTAASAAAESRLTASVQDPLPNATKFEVTIKCLGGKTCGVAVGSVTGEELKGSKSVGVCFIALNTNSCPGVANGSISIKRVTAAQDKLSIPSGSTKTLTVTLNAAGRGLLDRFDKLPTRLKITLSVAGEPSEDTTAKQPITFTRTKKKQ